MKNILIVEDEAIIAEELKSIVGDLGYNTLGPALDGITACDIFANQEVDLALLDITLKGNISGIDLAKLIREKYSFPFVFVSSHYDKSTLSEVKKTAPYGFIVKPFSESEIYATLELALFKSEQEKTKSGFPDISFFQTKSSEKITNREYDIIQLICAAMSYKEIASELFVSHNTIKSHTKNIFRKLNIHNKYELLKIVQTKQTP